MSDHSSSPRHVLRVVVVGGFLSYRALITYLTPALFIVMMIATPLLQIIAFKLLGQYSETRSTDFFVAGLSIQACSMAGIYGASQAVANERAFGTLAHILITPANRLWIMVGRLLPSTVNGLFSASLCMLIGWAFLGLRLGSTMLPGLLLAALTASLSCTAVGLLIGSLGLRFRDMYFVTNSAHLLLLIIAGAAVPTEVLPGWVHPLTQVMPMSHAIAAAQNLATGDTPHLATNLLWELLLAVGYFAAAVAVLKLSERSSRKTGTLELV